MLGSSRWNKAHDLERKLGPWKQARVMWLPWRLIEPPSCTASSGRGIWKREMWQPAITFSTPGQWRWWAASMSAWQSRLWDTKWEAGLDVGRRINSDWNMRHVAAGNRICFLFFLPSNDLQSFKINAAFCLFFIISWACLITSSFWTTLLTVTTNEAH